jgi:hypothetical protein
MSAAKHLKTFQQVSIIIQIIFRELVGSLLKSLNLKVFLKLWGLFVVIWQRVKKLIKTFKFSDFNKEPTSSLKMI